MASSSNDSTLLQRIRDRAETALKRAVETADRRLTEVEQRLRTLGPRLVSAQNIEQVQQTLARFARVVYGLGFTADDDARRLFELFDWVEQQHGRQPVVRALGNHNPLLDEQFVELIDHVRAIFSPTSDLPSPDPGQIEAFRDHASRQVLELLATLAALESDEPPPDSGTDEALASYVRDSPLPRRFDELVERALGDQYGPSADERTQNPSPPSGSARSSIERGIEMLAERDADFGALAEQMAPLFDRHLRFLSTSFLFATQAFLTRSAIDALPDLAEQSGAQSPDDTIDV
jgi:hypothetical protein